MNKYEALEKVINGKHGYSEIRKRAMDLLEATIKTEKDQPGVRCLDLEFTVKRLQHSIRSIQIVVNDTEGLPPCVVYQAVSDIATKAISQTGEKS